MKRFRISGIALVLISTIFLMFTSGCDDFGVFAVIAVSEKIDEGLLPEGSSPSQVLQISGLSTHDFMSTGGRLWSRNNSDRANITISNSWRDIDLNGWSNIQSIAQTDTRIVLTMVREDTNNHEVGLFYFDDTHFIPSSNTVNFQQITGTNWTDNGSSFYNAYVFCPDSGTEEIFINVLKTDAQFGSTSFNYVDSWMYLEDFSDNAWIGTDEGWTDLDTGTIVRYVDSAAFGNGLYVFSAVETAGEQSDNGVLLNQSGAILGKGAIDRPVSGITYLPTIGAFITGASAQDASSVYPIYAVDEADAGEVAPGQWVKIQGAGNGFRVHSFVDVIGTQAGGLNIAVNDKILAGTRSFSTTDAVGYVEIDVDGFTSPMDIPSWTVLTGSSRTFAHANNYLISDLSDVSINHFSIYDNFVYASSSGQGLWHINADDYPSSDGEPPRWVRE